MIYAIITYISCMVIVFALNFFGKKDKKLGLAGWFVCLALAPIVVIYGIYAYSLKIYYRNKPRPVSKKLRHYLKADTVLDEKNKTVSLYEYNRKHNTNYTLEDVYGKKYVESLPQDAKINFSSEKDFKNSIEIDEELNNDVYAEVAEAFANSREKGDWKEFAQKYLDKDVVLVSYKKAVFVGIEDFIQYWNELWERSKKKDIPYKTTIQHCAYAGHTAVLDSPKGYREMYVLFRIESNKVTHVVYAPQRLHNYSLIRYCDLDHDFSAHIKVEAKNEYDRLKSQALRLPCPHCGELSENMEWYYYNSINTGPLTYGGEVSICPHCNKYVEFCPETMIRNMMPIEQSLGT